MLLLVAVVLAQSAPCGASHVHHYSDLRLAIVQVGKVEKCHFYYSDIQERTSPAQPLSFDTEFQLIRVEFGEKKTTLTQVNKDRLKQGDFGLCIFCPSCHACLSLRLIDKSEWKSAG
jgi:hypothetical protein